MYIINCVTWFFYAKHLLPKFNFMKDIFLLSELRTWGMRQRCICIPSALKLCFPQMYWGIQSPINGAKHQMRNLNRDQSYSISTTYYWHFWRVADVREAHGVRLTFLLVRSYFKRSVKEAIEKAWNLISNSIKCFRASSCYFLKFFRASGGADPILLLDPSHQPNTASPPPQKKVRSRKQRWYEYGFKLKVALSFDRIFWIERGTAIVEAINGT